MALTALPWLPCSFCVLDDAHDIVMCGLVSVPARGMVAIRWLSLLERSLQGGAGMIVLSWLLRPSLHRKVGMAEDEFTALTLKALTRHDLGPHNFVYTLQPKEGRGGGRALQLAWKKYIVEDNVKFQLGSMTFDPQPSASALQRLLEHALLEAGLLRGQVGGLRRETERLAGERGAALARLEGCVGGQEALEAELFAKFKLVLNDKKAKIHTLLAQLEQASEAPPPPATPPHDNPPSAAGSDAETDDDLASDDDHAPSLHHAPSLRQPPLDLTATCPSDSLFGADARSLSPPAKRKRGRGPSQRGDRRSQRSSGLTPIPRPPSIPRPASQDARHPASKPSSSCRSEGGTDAEELLQLL